LQDKQNLKTIISKGLDVLCKTQRTRRNCKVALINKEQK